MLWVFTYRLKPKNHLAVPKESTAHFEGHILRFTPQT